MTKWSHPYSQYWEANVHDKIKHIGAWELRTFGLESVTTNQSESFNCVLKRIQEWKEAPVDAMALSLFRLSQFHVIEVRRGQSGNGGYRLREGIVPTPSYEPHARTAAPTEIVDMIRACESDLSLRDASTSTASATTSAALHSPVLPVVVTIASLPESVAPTTATGSTIGERAWDVVNNGQISLDTKLGVFTVMGTIEPRVVKLFPACTCSCPSVSDCYHIKAAQISVGMRTNVVRRQLNLTTLRRNTRKKADRRSGLKRPRLQDVDVIAAGDIETGNQPTSNAPSDTLPIGVVPDVMPSTPPSRVPTQAQPRSPQHYNCVECGLEEPPKRVSRQKKIQWIACDKCSFWSHICCLATVLPAEHGDFICSHCK
jgi:hypothetical protein